MLGPGILFATAPWSLIRGWPARLGPGRVPGLLAAVISVLLTLAVAALLVLGAVTQLA
jgi:hypothetical protein